LVGGCATVVVVGKTKVSWSVEEAVVVLVAALARAEGRSVSSAAERLLERALNGAGLGGEEPHGAGTDGGSRAVDASGGSRVLSSPPSPVSHFKPDPKPGKRQ
jgi:hypothetical protein